MIFSLALRSSGGKGIFCLHRCTAAVRELALVPRQHAKPRKLIVAREQVVSISAAALEDHYQRT